MDGRSTCKKPLHRQAAYSGTYTLIEGITTKSAEGPRDDHHNDEGIPERS